MFVRCVLFCIFDLILDLNIVWSNHTKDRSVLNSLESLAVRRLYKHTKKEAGPSHGQPFLTGKSLFSGSRMVTRFLEMANATCMSLIQLFASFFFTCFKWIRAQERGLPKDGAKCDPLFCEMAIWQVKWRYWGDCSMFRKKIATFSVDVIRTLLTGASFISRAVSEIQILIFFWHIVVFASGGFDSIEVLENWSRSKVGSFYPWNHTERWISQPIFAGPQSPSDDF